MKDFVLVLVSGVVIRLQADEARLGDRGVSFLKKNDPLNTVFFAPYSGLSGYGPKEAFEIQSPGLR